MRSLARKFQQSQSGVTYVELVVVITAVFFLVLIISNLPSSISSINKSRHTSIARDAAAKQIELIRKQDYDNVAMGATYFSDSSLSVLPSVISLYEVRDCPDTICTLSEDAKEVIVRVSWVESGDTKEVEFTTILSAGGLGY